MSKTKGQDEKQHPRAAGFTLYMFNPRSAAKYSMHKFDTIWYLKVHNILRSESNCTTNCTTF